MLARTQIKINGVESPVGSAPNTPLSSAPSSGPGTPKAIRRCAHCKTDINVSVCGVVSIRKRAYHPQCVQCSNCHKQVDGSILDKDGKMYCLQCSKDILSEKIQKEAKYDVEVTKSPLNEMMYAKEKEYNISDLSDFEKAFLNYHNMQRRRHSADPLKWSQKLTSKARKWAIHLIASSSKKNEVLRVFSLPDSGLGQTSCTIPAVSKPTVVEMANKVCQQWYKTGESFVVGEYHTAKESAPFTQMVWKGTERVGACLFWYGEVALVVAFYWPAGNIDNEFHNNVIQVLSSPNPMRIE